jgi:hypothetical protein
VSLGRAAVSGLRQPIVALLLLIALFTTVSGKLLDGLLMLAVATVLIFDGTRSRRQSAAGTPVPVAPRRPSHHRPPTAGSFSRYSWPATTPTRQLAR